MDESLFIRLVQTVPGYLIIAYFCYKVVMKLLDRRRNAIKMPTNSKENGEMIRRILEKLRILEKKVDDQDGCFRRVEDRIDSQTKILCDKHDVQISTLSEINGSINTLSNVLRSR